MCSTGPVVVPVQHSSGHVSRLATPAICSVSPQGHAGRLPELGL